jgi:hypothetical protein
MALDVACDGDPLQWAALHRELTSAACEQIQYWEQDRASDQILDVFHQRPGGRADEIPEEGDHSSVSTKSPEYCAAIDGMIGEVAAGEIIRYLDQEAADPHIGPRFEELVDQALRQSSSAPAEPDTAD